MLVEKLENLKALSWCPILRMSVVLVSHSQQVNWLKTEGLNPTVQTSLNVDGWIFSRRSLRNLLPNWNLKSLRKNIRVIFQRDNFSGSKINQKWNEMSNFKLEKSQIYFVLRFERLCIGWTCSWFVVEPFFQPSDRYDLAEQTTQLSRYMCSAFKGISPSASVINVSLRSDCSFLSLFSISSFKPISLEKYTCVFPKMVWVFRYPKTSL